MITYLICYLLDKKQERVKIHNLLQELIQRQKYMKYALPDGKSSHRNRMNYSFNEFFNNLSKIRGMNCIFLLLV